MPFMDGDYDVTPDEFHRDLNNGEVLNKIQGRPLPAPPRPPRHRRSFIQSRQSLSRDFTPDFSENVASTQTDPLPDDLVIEEEITTAKLVVTPSRSGSGQIMISTERIPSPGSGSYRSVDTPPIPPLPSTKNVANDTKMENKGSSALYISILIKVNKTLDSINILKF